MSSMVIDSSVTMAWCFEDESSALADAVLDRLSDAEAWVPALWPLEVANVLLVAERRSRLTPADSARFVELLAGLPILIDEGSHRRALGAVLACGRELGLSAYDAAYLELAMRRGAEMATADEKLRVACRESGIPVFDPA